MHKAITTCTKCGQDININSFIMDLLKYRQIVQNTENINFFPKCAKVALV